MLGWCLLELAFHQQLTAALLLPLYYLSDATLTLLGRLIRREPFWAAHRSHFYQRATDNGFTALGVVSQVATLNAFLAALAVASTQTKSVATESMLLAAGCTAVALVLYRFAQPRASGRVA
jgi:UDP-N-acetylmuramyl pentapeptide phosphotransferase/UDP-N-acetylglucosamine-1-phosphate transferase